MQALILAGGSGTRFWPLSRRRHPKQLLALDGELSLLANLLYELGGVFGDRRFGPTCDAVQHFDAAGINQ